MSKTGHFAEFELPPWFRGPKALRVLREELWNQCYPNLYEEGWSPPQALAGAVTRVLVACSDEAEDRLGHQRLVSMALTLCSAVAVTVDACLPGDPRPARVIARLEEWLRDPVAYEGEDIISMFPRVATPPQALHEALDVLYQSMRTISSASAMEVLREIVLDDCLEGYASFPGSDERRDLFNWWLLEVVPAAWYLRKPDFIYTMRLPWPPSSGTINRARYRRDLSPNLAHEARRSAGAVTAGDDSPTGRARVANCEGIVAIPQASRCTSARGSDMVAAPTGGWRRRRSNVYTATARSFSEERWGSTSPTRRSASPGRCTAFRRARPFSGRTAHTATCQHRAGSNDIDDDGIPDRR